MHPLKLGLVIVILLMLLACQSNAQTPVSTAVVTATPVPTASPVTPPTARPPAPTLVPTPPRAEASRGGIAVLGMVGVPSSLNPVTEIEPVLHQLAPLLFESLLQADPVSATLRPNLAERWDYSSDGRQVTFSLPPNLKWSDGSPLTAADVAASLQATQHPALLKFSQISAPDAQTLQLDFLQIDCAAVTFLALLPLLPAAQILESQPLGSGPFAVDNWSEDGRTLTLRRNENGRGGGALLDGLTVRFIEPGTLDVVLSEGAGQFDVLGPLSGPATPPANFSQRTFTAPNMVYIAMNYAPEYDSPLPPEVRAALARALDREAILSELLAGDGQLLTGTLLPDHWAARPENSLPAYNPDEARTLLRQAGLRDTDNDGWLDDQGKRLDLSIRLNDKDALHQGLGWLASNYYRDLGLFSRAESIPPDALIDDLFQHDFLLAIFNWPILPDPDQRMYWHSAENEVGLGLNFTSYNNPQLDSLLNEAVAVPGCALEARAELYRQVQSILSEDRPVDVVLAANQHVFTAGRLQGVEPGPFAPLTWNAGDWHTVE